MGSLVVIKMGVVKIVMGMCFSSVRKLLWI